MSELSNCHQAPVIVKGGAEGTNHYECTNCKQACDLYVANNTDAIIDETLDCIGFASKPGSTKGRMYSSRFYHKELKMFIKQLIATKETEAHKLGYAQGILKGRAGMRKQIEGKE